MVWDNNILAGGPGPSCHFRQRAEKVSVELNRSTFTTPALHFILELSPTAALGEGDRPPPYDVKVTENVFNSGYFFGFFQDFPRYVPEVKALPADQAEALLPRLVAWRGQRNVYSRGISLLGLGAVGESHQAETLQPTRARTTLADWQQLWGRAETDSLQGRVVFQGGDVAIKADTALDQVVPAVFQLHSDSVGKSAGEGGHDLGADVDYVGPGAAYQRWKTTPAYQEWLRAIGQSP